MARTPAPDLAGLVERLEADRLPQCSFDDGLSWETDEVIVAETFARCARAIRDLEAESARLAEALEPFAKAADKLDGKWSADDWRWNDSVRSAVTVSHIRKARAALSGRGRG